MPGPIHPVHRQTVTDVHPDATSAALGWTGVQAHHFRDVSGRPDGYELPGMSHHMLNVLLDTRFEVDNAWDGQHYKGTHRTEDLSLVPAHRPARWRWRGLSRECLHVFLDPALLARTAEAEWDRDPAGVDLVGDHRFNDPALLRLSLGLRDELLQGGGLGGRLLAESTAAAIAVHLLRHHSTLSPARSPARGGLAPWRLRRALDFLEANLNRQVGLAELAAVAGGLSESYFARAFKVAVGEAPYACALRLRVERAQELLLADPGLGVAEVALLCGFADQAHLTAVFRRVTGLPPAAWRLARLR